MSDKNHDLLELIEAKRRCEDLEKEVVRLLLENKELRAYLPNMERLKDEQLRTLRKQRLS